VTQQVLAAFGDTVQSFDGNWTLADAISADGAGAAGTIMLSPTTTVYASCPGGRCVLSCPLLFPSQTSLLAESLNLQAPCRL
jgi:hypothetical protein